VDEVAASGGYLMACVADRVIASPFAILGSIGVVAMAPNVYERLQREGLRVDDITAGKYKRTLTPYRKWNSTDQAAMQRDVDAVHEVFKGFVKRHRPRLQINEVATGQVGAVRGSSSHIPLLFFLLLLPPPPPCFSPGVAWLRCDQKGTL
jgi:serine protease SohB